MYKLFAHLPQMNCYYKKESVRQFVYLTAGIWRGLRVNKQYLTPSGISSEIYPYTVMSVVLLILTLSKSPNFAAKD